MCFFSKSSRYLVSVNPVANLLRISAVPAVFSVSSVFHQVYEVFYSRIEQCRLLHTFSGSKFPTQFLNFSSNFKNPAYKFQISAQISNFRTKFLVPSTKFHRVTDPSQLSLSYSPLNSRSDESNHRSLQGKSPSSARFKSFIFISLPCLSLHPCGNRAITWLSFLLQTYACRHLVPHVILHLMVYFLLRNK